MVHKVIFPSLVSSLKVPNSNPFMTCAIDLQSTLCPFSSTQWSLYFYAYHALYIYQYHFGPLILDASQTHTLSNIFPMPLWLCGEIQGDLIFDAPSISTSYKYVKSSLFSKIFIYFKPSFFEIIHVPFVSSPFLEISLDNPFTLNFLLRFQTILNMYTHVILGVLKLNIKVPAMLLHHSPQVN